MFCGTNLYKPHKLLCVDFSLSHSGIEEMNAGVYYISNKDFVFGMQNKLKTRIGF